LTIEYKYRILSYSQVEKDFN